MRARPAGGSILRLHRKVLASVRNTLQAGSVKLPASPSEKLQVSVKSARLAPGVTPSSRQTSSDHRLVEETRTSAVLDAWPDNGVARDMSSLQVWQRRQGRHDRMCLGVEVDG